MLWNNNKFF